MCPLGRAVCSLGRGEKERERRVMTVKESERKDIGYNSKSI